MTNRPLSRRTAGSGEDPGAVRRFLLQVLPLVKSGVCPYSGCMLIRDVEKYLTGLLDLEAFARADVSMNGLQVGDSSREVRKVAFAVDACLDSFLRAADAGAGLLVVHHGLYWGAPVPVTGDFFRRISCLVERGLALFAAHLPLDSHPEVGNNAALAAALGLEQVEPFGLYHGLKIGCKGVLPRPASLDGVLESLGLTRQDCLSVLPFGGDTIRTVAIVSGGAASDVVQAMEEGADLYLTGEVSHQIYHACLEGRICFAAAGHYFTETFGVRALARRLQKDTGLETVFIDVPTGL